MLLFYYLPEADQSILCNYKSGVYVNNTFSFTFAHLNLKYQIVEIACLPHQATHFFSKLNLDYLADEPVLRPLYQYRPDDAGLADAIRDRAQFPVDRPTLVTVLKEQYGEMELSDRVAANLDALLKCNTYTVCTAHQPNLMTGYLYFIYKILHAVKLAQHLETLHPGQQFVPVFYMGSEDNDLDELGVFRFNEKRFRWETPQTGAVGRMRTDDLKEVLLAWEKLVGPPGANAEQLKKVMLDAYQQHPTIAAATRSIVNTLMGKYGVLVLDPDDARLKRNFLPELQAELFEPKAHELVQRTTALLNDQYKAQAFSRPVNLFYLKDQIRERIEYQDGKWQVLHTDITFGKEELEQEVQLHPERFSPNVILRGLYQERILPNVAFIGGGSEVAYWMQLKPVFEHYRVFFPALILRQSIQIIEADTLQLQQRLSLTDTDIFVPEETLSRSFVQRNSQHQLSLKEADLQLQELFENIRAKAVQVDVTLDQAAAAALTKMNRQLQIIQQKMMRAEKRKMSEDLKRIERLKQQLFPGNSLQERYDTFMPFYLTYSNELFDILLNAILPYGNEFVLLKAAEKS
jgi:bacillithiol biosynthesis cysteine-adding enzyme BshC